MLPAVPNFDFRFPIPSFRFPVSDLPELAQCPGLGNPTGEVRDVRRLRMTNLVQLFDLGLGQLGVGTDARILTSPTPCRFFAGVAVGSTAGRGRARAGSLRSH